MKLRNALLIGGALTAFIVAPVLADVNYTQGTGTVIFDFLCFTTKHCSSHVPINSAGTEIATSSNPLRTDPTGTTPQPATQSGTWTVQPGNTANTTAWKVDGSAVTQPVSNAGTFAAQLTGATNNINNIAGTVSLPTGASTSSNQTSQITQETATATGVGTPTDAVATAPASASSASMIALLKALLNTGQYPAGATALTASATGTTAATTATLAGSVGKTTYICSYSIRANATAATTVLNTVTGVITATMSHQMWVAPLASGIGVDEQVFNPCVPASGTNQAIAVVSGAPGSGGLVSATATGYQL